MSEETFKFFVPTDVEKSSDGSHWLTRGIASTATKDWQGDIIPPKAIRIDFLKSNGWISYEHKYVQDDPDTTKYIVGAPTENTRVTDDGLYVEADLIKNNPYAKEYFELAQDLKKSGINRRLGYSIEGVVSKRNEENPDQIDEVMITNVALTTSPANPDARFDAVVKSLNDKFEKEHPDKLKKDASFTTGYGTTPETQQDAAALRPENFTYALHVLSSSLKELKAMDLKESVSFYNQAYDHMEKNTDTFGEDDLALFLQVSKGYSEDIAHRVVREFKEGENRAPKPI